jgi:hypothetical protein
MKLDIESTRHMPRGFQESGSDICLEVCGFSWTDVLEIVFTGIHRRHPRTR